MDYWCPSTVALGLTSQQILYTKKIPLEGPHWDWQCVLRSQQVGYACKLLAADA